MAIPPNYLQPLIGYAMNLLGKGNSASQVKAYMERNSVYSMLPERDRQQALNFALSNMVATVVARVGSSADKLVDILGKIIPTEQPVGVRIIADVEDESGRSREISITINAPPWMTPEQVEAYAKAHVESGQYRPHTGNQYPGQVVDIHIVGIYEGGLENPNLDLMNVPPTEIPYAAPGK